MLPNDEVSECSTILAVLIPQRFFKANKTSYFKELKYYEIAPLIINKLEIMCLMITKSYGVLLFLNALKKDFICFHKSF